MTTQGDASRKKVLEYLLQHVSEGREKCGPNFKEVGEALDMDTTTVVRVIKQLKEAKQLGHISSGKKHWYSLPVEDMEEEPAAPARTPRKKYTEEEAAEAKNISAQFMKALSGKDYAGMTDILETGFQDLPLRKKKSTLSLAFTCARMNGDDDGLRLVQEANLKYLGKHGI